MSDAAHVPTHLHQSFAPPLNAGEVLCSGSTYDCAGVGWVVKLDRNNDTAALGEFWCAYRAQTQGTVDADVAFSAIGDFRIGLDLSFLSPATATPAAITLAADQRIYGNVTATDPTGVSRFPSALGDDYFTFSSSINAWNFIVNGSSRLQIQTNKTHIAGWFSITDGVPSPGAIPGYAQIYVDSADGDLKVIFGDGTIKTIATDT